MSDSVTEVEEEKGAGVALYLPPESPNRTLKKTFSNMHMAEPDGTHQTYVSSPIPRKASEYKLNTEYNPIPQAAPGASAAVGHKIENSIPLSIFPIATDKFCICFCGLPGRGKTHISRRLAKYLTFFHAANVELYNVSQYRRKTCGAVQDADWFDSRNTEAR
jgi:hypothetical protein